MRKYGFRIGVIGLEFPSLQDRDKAIQTFTHCSVILISDNAGPRYAVDSNGSFSVYDRDTNEQTMNCSGCKCQFTSETCTQRSVPKRDWQGKFQEGDIKEWSYLCDGCFAKLMKEYEIYKAEKVLNHREG